jgi:acyl carrier protein
MSDHQAASLRHPAAIATADELSAEVAGLIVQALNLEISPAQIAADEPLYGEGLGLDSIDILEIALVVSKKYGVQLRADSGENIRIFGSLRQLVDYIIAHRTK